MVVMIIILFFILGITLYTDKIPELPKNISLLNRIKLKIIGIFSSVKGGFSTFFNLLKINTPTF